MFCSLSLFYLFHSLSRSLNLRLLLTQETNRSSYDADSSDNNDYNNINDAQLTINNCAHPTDTQVSFNHRVERKFI